MKSNLWRVHPAREMFHYFNQGLVMSAAQYKSLETKMDATQAQLEAAKDSQLS